MNKQNIVFFDGHCILCNGFVDFLLKADKSNSLFFAPLQGTTAKDVVPQNYLANLQTVIFIDYNRQLFMKSNAVIRIIVSLGRFWKLGRLFYIIPRPVRDYIYDWVARNRFNWFGRREVCRVPSQQEKSKVLP
jgi:prepilin-type processing-associated H-X9-DG protein